MITKAEFKIYRSDWIPRVGFAVVIIGLDLMDPNYRSSERYIFLTEQPDVNSCERWRYKNIPRDMISDEELYQDQLAASANYLTNYLHAFRKYHAPGADIRVPKKVALHEMGRAFLLRIFLTSIGSNIFHKILTQSYCSGLKKYLEDIRKRSSSFEVEEI